MKNKPNEEEVQILGVGINPFTMDTAVTRVEEALHARRKGYACLIGVHGIIEAQRDPALADIYAHAAMMVPDGAPTVWMGYWQGFRKMERVTGPDLMIEIFRRNAFSKSTHFLYGGRPGVAEELRDSLLRRFPHARIVGTYTPPFRDLSSKEEQSVADLLHSLQPDIVWVGISTPKQERFMSRMLPLLDSMLMFGVGAAFDFHTGRIKDSPQWVKRAGLQWLHRLMQDPRRLFWRYLRNNSAFLWHIMLQLTGIRRYPVKEVAPKFSVSQHSSTDA